MFDFRPLRWTDREGAKSLEGDQIKIVTENLRRLSAWDGINQDAAPPLIPIVQEVPLDPIVMSQSDLPGVGLSLPAKLGRQLVRKKIAISRTIRTESGYYGKTTYYWLAPTVSPPDQLENAGK